MEGPGLEWNRETLLFVYPCTDHGVPQEADRASEDGLERKIADAKARALDPTGRQSDIRSDPPLCRMLELSYTPKGTTACKFTVASNRSFKQDDELQMESRGPGCTSWRRRRPFYSMNWAPP